MRIVLFTIIALIAFAANSVLVRLALANAEIGPGAFGAIRLLSGAVMLAAIVAARGGVRLAWRQRWLYWSTSPDFPMPMFHLKPALAR